MHEHSATLGSGSSEKNYLTGFGTDLDGEMYVLGKDVLGPTGDTGMVFRIVGPGNS